MASSQLFKPQPQLIASGLHPGIPALNVPLWADGRNVQFRAEGVKSLNGWGPVRSDVPTFDGEPGLFDDALGLFDDAGTLSDLISPGTRPIRSLMAQRLSSGIQRLVFAQFDKVWSYEGGQTATELGVGFTGFEDETATRAATVWSVVPFGDWVLATNGIIQAQITKTGAALSFANLSGTTFTFADIFARIGPHVVAFGTSNFGRAEWCAEDNPEQWDPNVNPTAGFLPLRDLSSPVICVKQLGDALGVYAQDEMQVFRFLGPGLFRFGVLPALQHIGAVSKNSVVSVNRLNYGINQAGIFFTDGNSYRYVKGDKFGLEVGEQFSVWLRDNVNWEQKSKISGWHDELGREIRWALPLVGSQECNVVMGFNYDTQAISFYDMPASVGLDAGVFRRAIIGATSGKLYFTDLGLSADGQSLRRWVQTRPIDAGAPEFWKYLDVVQVVCKILAGSNVSVYIGWQEEPDSVIDWSGPFPVSKLLDQLHPRLEGVYLSLRFETQDTSTEWLIAGFELFGTRAGRKF